MNARVIQGLFADGRPRLSPMVAVLAPVASPVPARRPGPPLPSAVAQRHGGGGTLAVDAGRLGLVPHGGRPLPDGVRTRMEAAFQASFADVRVHVGPQAGRIGAIAFTTGSDIYFASGRYQPESVPGLHLLGHELAHVIQQRSGRVRHPLGSGVAVVHDTALEAEADRLGRQAATRAALPSVPSPPLQRRCPPGRTTGLPAIQAKDRSARIVELMGEDVPADTIRANVASACRKVQLWAQPFNFDTVGRDIFFYSKKGWWKNTNVSQLLAGWDPDDNSPSDTAGMLMDFALAWQRSNAGGGVRRGRQWRDQYAGTRPVGAKRDKAGRLLTALEEGGRAGEHAFDMGSTYGQLATQHHYAVKAGPSASTAQVLWMLRSIGTVTNTEAKSVAHALANFWGGGFKSLSGDYHTKFEVMIPLARHLGKGNKFQPDPVV